MSSLWYESENRYCLKHQSENAQKLGQAKFSCECSNGSQR